MADEQTKLPLLSTKLNRPPVTGTFVPRPRLLESLSLRLQGPLTLISAPAGYGKTTLVSSWLAHCNHPSAWLSLDENDNDLRTFATYFLTAVRSLYPEVGAEVHSMLSAPTLPSPQTIARCLVNEMDPIDGVFILAIDDYHFINEKAVNDFIIELLRHPCRAMHLVLVTRMDPYLPLTSLRAKGRMTEIRIPDLRFSRKETASFFEMVLGVPVEDSAIAAFEEKTEGWITGLRLALLSLRHRSDLNHIMKNLPVENRFVTDYLLDEVLENQPKEMQDYLLATAMLDRFCASLCDAVCAPDSGSLECKVGGKQFLDWLEASDLFVVPLDEQGQWFRYHHLFQKLLQRRLKDRVRVDDISALCQRASRWFAGNDLIDEALKYALAAGDVSAAAQLVEQNRHAPLNEDKWYVLKRWLSRLPDDIVKQRPELLLAKVWVLYFQFELGAVSSLLEAIETLGSKAVKQLPRGEIDLLNGILLYWKGQGERAMELIGRALEQMPAASIGLRNEAEIYYAVSCQAAGQGKTAAQMFRRKMSSETSEGTTKLRLLASLLFIHLLSGELVKAEEEARMLHDMATRTVNPHVQGWSSYVLGLVQYQWNDLEAAGRNFSRAVENRFALDSYADIDNYAGLILSYQGLQQPDKAEETVNRMMEYAQETGDPVRLLRARSVQARQCLMQGDSESAIRWLETADFSFDTGTMFFWLELPRITQCRVLIAQGSKAGLHQAKIKLGEHLQLASATHNTPHMIEALILQSMVCLDQGQTDEARAVLEQAVALARPGGYIRPFVNLGLRIAELLRHLLKRGKRVDYIERILNAFDSNESVAVRDNPPPQPDQKPWMRNAALDKPLTNRELEILSYLARGLRDKDIADKLFISPGTVKKHTVSIYRKLNAHTRQLAVVQAYRLGILKQTT